MRACLAEVDKAAQALDEGKTKTKKKKKGKEKVGARAEVPPAEAAAAAEAMVVDKKSSNAPAAAATTTNSDDLRMRNWGDDVCGNGGAGPSAGATAAAFAANKRPRDSSSGP